MAKTCKWIPYEEAKGQGASNSADVGLVFCKNCPVEQQVSCNGKGEVRT